MGRAKSPFGPAPRGYKIGFSGVRWGEVDWHVLATALCLLTFGLVFLKAMSESGASVGSNEIHFDRHLQKVAVTLPAVAVGFLLRPRFLRANALLFYFGAIFLLCLVPIFGEERNQAVRWIPTPVFDLQPSELAKIGVILALARVLYRNRLANSDDWMPPLVIAFLPMVLVASQPDLGTALTMVPVTLGMLYLAGARARVIGRFVMGVAVIGILAFHFDWVRGYQSERIDTWLESYAADDLIGGRRGSAFHQYQARVVIGHGGVLGRGLGKGVANETGYLPERDSDSIFCVIAEEAGFLGAAALLLLYTVLVVLLMERASSIRDRFARLLIGGIAIYFGSHMFINVAVNLGLLPMTGLTLPLFSTGGSSLLASFLALGLALGVASHHEPSLDRDAFRDY